MNFDPFVDYFNTLEKKYDWTYAQWRPIRDIVDSFLARRNDVKLYLGVAGEFSSGKSTLINALLHKDVLKEDVLQGTTCAPTFICYGSQFDVEILFNDGRRLRLQDEIPIDNDSSSLEPDDPAVREFINRYTADENYASSVDRVLIYLRNRILRNGLVIIDTPGINANNIRHSQVTQDIIQKFCDAALVIIPATTPCSQTLCNFVRDYLETIQKRCIGVVTQIDRIRPREQARQMSFINTRMTNETHRNLAAIVPVSARFANEKHEDSELDVFYKKMFSDFENVFQQKLSSGRAVILNEKLTEILQNSILPQMTNIVNARQQEVEKRRDLLSAKQLANPKEWLNLKTQEYNDRIAKQDEGWQTAVMKVADDKYSQLMQDLDNATSKESVRWIATTGFQEKCKSIWHESLEAIQPYRERFFLEAQKILGIFKQEFSDAYRNLSVSVSVDIDTSFDMKELDSQDSLSMKINNETGDLLQQLDAAYSDSVFNQTEFGASVGNFLKNNLGDWAHRGVSRLTNMFGDPTQMREELREMLKKQFPFWCQNALMPGIRKVLDEACSNAQNGVARLMDIYYQSHETVINNIIERENAELNELCKKLDSTQADLDILNRFQTQIDSDAAAN